jgi:hypothetical protein
MSMPVTVSVGPLASGSLTAISLAQGAAGAQSLVLNGALGNAVANNICASQSPGGAGNLTINGTLASAGVAYLGEPRPVYITSAGDDSGITFTVYGTSFSANGGVFAQVETVTGANASVVQTNNLFWTVTRVAVSDASAAAVTVGRGASVATLDNPRTIAIDSDGDDTGITFTVTGTDANGSPQSEVIVGENAADAASVLSYKTVTSIVTSGAVATTVTVGTGDTATSEWVRFDDYAGNAQVAVQAAVDGTVNYSVEFTMDDPNSLMNPVAKADVVWSAPVETTLTSQTGSKFGYYPVGPVFARVLLNSGDGSVRTTFRQVYQN